MKNNNDKYVPCSTGKHHLDPKNDVCKTNEKSECDSDCCCHCHCKKICYSSCDIDIETCPSCKPTPDKLAEAKKPWDEEDWKKAPGINCSMHETNAGLATRDYSVPCQIPSQNKITVIQGYWLWWCSAHHQPAPWCDKAKQDLISYERGREEQKKIDVGIVKEICSDSDCCGPEIYQKILNTSSDEK